MSKKGQRIWIVEEEIMESWEGTPTGEYTAVSYHATEKGANSAMGAASDEALVDFANIASDVRSVEAVIEDVKTELEFGDDNKDLLKFKKKLGTGKPTIKSVAAALRVIEDYFENPPSYRVTSAVLGE